ncbi:MAG: protein kinase [Thermoactinospora sp.]|nr:protein kinase [Thermoactinospora sp.]
MNQDDRLGPYRLLRRLGEGGMGVVHLAVDSAGRQVAVKVLRSEVAGDDVARRRLSREVETMQRVRSKYIAEVLDADVTGHRPYIVTRYVPGRPLDEIVKEDGPLDLAALIRVAHGVAAALAAVHSVGVIHRDLKPGNVLILDGEPVLIDFGIAQAVDATRLTQTGMFIGTPQYLAPEIIEGHEAGPEVDVHAWAGTLLYGATGQPPFGKGTLEMIFYNITAGKADISAAPGQLQPFLKAAFQRNPSKRPKAAELAEQTARLLPKPAGRVPDEVSTVPRADRNERPDPTPPPSGPFVSLLPQQPSSGTGSQGSGQGGTPAGHEPSTVPRRPDRQPTADRPGFGSGVQQGFGSDIQPGFGSGAHQGSGPHQGSGSHQSSGYPGSQQGYGSGPQQAPGQGSGPQQAGGYGSGPQQAPGYPGSQQGYGSGPQQPGAPADNSPTRRVSPEELRRMREEAQSWQPGPREADVATRRVPPAVAEQLRASGGHQPPPYVPPVGSQSNPAVQQHYPPDPPTRRAPDFPGAALGNPLKRSKAYGVAGAMLLVIMIVAAALAPVLVAAVAIPFAILLRAADLAQPQLTGRRPGPAAFDWLWVLAYPKALAKSLGVTLALVFYAAILGLPVTLLLTVIVKMDAGNALAWGAAVALWTICAGPGVEGPSRQMRRTLSSLVPSKTVAMTLAGVLAVVAAGSLWVAYGTAGRTDPTEANWTPVDVGFVEGKLKELQGGTAGK